MGLYVDAVAFVRKRLLDGTLYNDIDNGDIQIGCLDQTLQRPYTALACPIRSAQCGLVRLKRLYAAPISGQLGPCAVSFIMPLHISTAYDLTLLLADLGSPVSYCSAAISASSVNYSLTVLLTPWLIRMHAQRVVRTFSGSAYLWGHPAMGTLPVMSNFLVLVCVSFAQCVGVRMLPSSSAVLSCSAGKL